MPVTTTTHTVLKLAVENNTPGTNLSLCAGSDADFAAGTAGIILLSDSGGPGFKFLTIIDTHALSDKIIYVLRAVGTSDAQFYPHSRLNDSCIPMRAGINPCSSLLPRFTDRCEAAWV